MLRYAAFAPVYDLMSLERPVYRPGRLAAVQALRLQPGQTVLAVGCGTGLSLPVISSRLGPRGHVVGIDTSASMLRAARRHSDLPTRQTLIRADATHLNRGDLPADIDEIDAVLFVYSLSIMRPWQAAWQSVTDLLRPGARVAVADMALPDRGGIAGAAAARILCAAGGSDIDAHPWSAVERDCTAVTSQQFWGGHVQVRAGVWPGSS